jgi:hypothetical protein
MELTPAQKREFYERGYVKLPGVVPAEMVHNARRAINAYIGQNGMDPNELTKYRAQSYCPGLGGEPIITDLYNATPIKDCAESAIGAGKVKPVGYGQIALRFPAMDPPREPGPHIDGMYTPTNGVKEGTIANFTALVGVFLSDLPDPTPATSRSGRARTGSSSVTSGSTARNRSSRGCRRSSCPPRSSSSDRPATPP